MTTRDGEQYYGVPVTKPARDRHRGDRFQRQESSNDLRQVTAPEVEQAGGRTLSWGTLALNSTHLVWEWLRNDDPWNPPGERVGDSFVLTTRAARK